MSHQSELFDRQRYRMQRANTTHCTSDDFLRYAAQERVAERLDTMRRAFARAVIIGAADASLAHHPSLKHCVFIDNVVERLPGAAHQCVADEEWLPLRADSVDVIIIIGALHHVNDMVGTLIQARMALKDDGLLLCITPGATSLHELRASLAHVQMQRLGGISPIISPFIDVRDAGALLGRTGFALPVVDSEIITITYEKLLKLLYDIRDMGEAAILHERPRSMITPRFITALVEYYTIHYSDDEQRLQCTAELLCLTAWKPHSSQQQPLARGSASVNMKQFFNGDT